MRINLKMAREEIAKIPSINLCATDDRIVGLINRSVERIIEESRSQELHRRIRICVYDACITTPPGVVALTDVALCADPIPLRGEWYEFLPDKGGVFVEQKDGPVSLHDRGETCTIQDITGSNSKLKFYLSIEEDLNTYVFAYGRDGSDRPLRTDHTGLGVEIKDGERVQVGGTGPFNSTNVFTSLDHFTKPRTRGQMRVYEVDQTTLSERLIAIYEHFETAPSYRRYLLRGAGCSGSGCGAKTITAMAKLEFIPAVNDEDLLPIPSMEALRMMCSAVVRMDNSDERAGIALSGEAMRRMGMHRDHVSPVERIAIGLRTRPSRAALRNRIGKIR